MMNAIQDSCASRIESEKTSAPKVGAQRGDRAIFDTVCAVIIGLFIFAAEPGVLELQSHHAQRAYYNQLIDGFRAGQLNLKAGAAPGFDKLADPYDPANIAYTKTVFDMAYYKGKFYFYYGVVPALVLYWPYEALTGGYLPDAFAVGIFLSVGFMAAACLLFGVWRRYFHDVSIWILAAGTFGLGAALVSLELGWLFYRITEVAVSCAFAFSMLSLVAIWRALEEPKRPVKWLLLAGLAYGLAIASRPSLLFGAIILLVPAARAWYAATGRDARLRTTWLLAAATGPVAAIGMGMMVYNYLRFDNPFEFGLHYQLTNYRASTVTYFSPHYFWFNVWFYFLEPMHWSSQFPFLQLIQPLTSLPPRYLETGAAYGGIIPVSFPLMWLALAAPQAWKNRLPEEVSVLRWFVMGAFLLLIICGLSVCLFFCAFTRYELDFLPGLMVLSVIGILSLERALVGVPKWRLIARWGWCLLLVYSLTFDLLASTPKAEFIGRSVCWLFR